VKEIPQTAAEILSFHFSSNRKPVDFPLCFCHGFTTEKLGLSL
jgi:hypothetical protein